MKITMKAWSKFCQAFSLSTYGHRTFASSFERHFSCPDDKLHTFKTDKEVISYITDKYIKD